MPEYNDTKEYQSYIVRVTRITFRAQDSGYAVLRCATPTGEDLTVTGTFPGIREDMNIKVTGAWANHPRFGRQFQAATWLEVLPTSEEAMRKYLSSGLIAGIGPVLADRLVDAFGTETFDVIENHPERLSEVYGVGAKKIQSIITKWKDQQAVREIMVFLKEHDVPDALAAKIYNRYKDESIAVLRANPYRLADELRGVGFKTADRLAMNLGVDPLSPVRMKYCAIFALEEAQTSGHMFVTRKALKEAMNELLQSPDIEEQMLDRAISSLRDEQRTVEPDWKIMTQPDDNDAVYLKGNYEAETCAAAKIALLASRREITPVNIDTIEEACGTKYAPLQRKAITTAVSSGMTIITGGPGTGKTTTVKGILAALDEKSEKTLLASPTGKAAKRLEEATGRKAATIHRLLEWSPQNGGFSRDEDNPLEGNAIIVDETSMVDGPLLDSLMNAIPEKMRVIMVGDADQLPSVGPGNCLHEMIASQRIPTIRLNTIFRQALDSDIIRGAHAINAGHVPDTSQHKDLWFAVRETPEAVADTIVATVQGAIKKGTRIEDIQVLTPMKKGPAGTEELNRRLQDLLNKDGKPVLKGVRELRVGDKVINLKNDYEKEVFNGDQGTIVDEDEDENTIIVDFDGRLVPYPKTDADTLLHAWAITVHRSQGSEFKTVIMALTSSHTVMLQRQLLYTAVTRAKNMCILIGDEQAMHRAVRNNHVRHRNTRLARLIQTSN